MTRALFNLAERQAERIDTLRVDVALLRDRLIETEHEVASLRRLVALLADDAGLDVLDDVLGGVDDSPDVGPIVETRHGGWATVTASDGTVVDGLRGQDDVAYVVAYATEHGTLSGFDAQAAA